MISGFVCPNILQAPFSLAQFPDAFNICNLFLYHGWRGHIRKDYLFIFFSWSDHTEEEFELKTDIRIQFANSQLKKTKYYQRKSLELSN